MSKSLGNVVDPDEIINTYGADTARLFILFAAPPANDLDWSERGVEGANRFLNRVWRLVEENIALLSSVRERPSLPMERLSEQRMRDLKRKIHTTIRDVTRDIADEKQFNTAVARLMELLNALSSFRRRGRRALFRGGRRCSAGLPQPLLPSYNRGAVVARRA